VVNQRYVEVDEDAGVEPFYYFVQSESEFESGAASDAPFLFWLTGGDRCSVFSGLAYEIGKIRDWHRWRHDSGGSSSAAPSPCPHRALRTSSRTPAATMSRAPPRAPPRLLLRL